MARLPGFPLVTAAPFRVMALLASPSAHATDTPYSFALGDARAHFNVNPGDFDGFDDVNALGFEAPIPMDDGKAAALDDGYPPVACFRAQGAGATMGHLGSARARFPATTEALVVGPITRSVTMRADPDMVNRLPPQPAIERNLS
jgi:hypothetical protein